MQLFVPFVESPFLGEGIKIDVRSMIQKKCVDPTWNICGHTYVFLACQFSVHFISSSVKFSHTLNTCSVAGRIKNIIKN